MKKKTKKEVFAVWDLEEIPALDNCGEEAPFEEQVHISCGVDDDQWEGFFLESDKGARLTIEHKPGGGYRVEFTAPAQDLDQAGYWMSPNTLGPDEIEASDYGMRPAKG
jgi:hypothetical protein